MGRMALPAGPSIWTWINSGTLNTDAVGTLEPSAITNVDGDYVINHLVPGNYRVAEVVPTGWTPTSPVSQDVIVVQGQDTKADFFNFSGGDIVGTVWNDLNGCLPTAFAREVQAPIPNLAWPIGRSFST